MYICKYLLKKLITVSEEVERYGKDQDCLVVAILSHGNEEGLISTMTEDGPVFLQSFYNSFSPIVVPALAGKPKIFLKMVGFDFFV